MSRQKMLPAGRMREGDEFRFRQSTVDQFHMTDLAGIEVDADCFPGSSQWLSYQQPHIAQLRRRVWVPSWMDPEREGKQIRALRTGGRTALLDGVLGKKIALDLAYHGWSDKRVLQEVMPEVKGAGTLIDGTSLQLHKARNTQDPRLLELLRAYDAGEEVFCFSGQLHGDTPTDSRPKGAQKPGYAMHALDVSMTERRTFPVKFAPVIYTHNLPADLRASISALDETLPPHTKRDYGTFGQEIRLTPSTVRAVYFDKASSDTKLVQLMRRVSEDPKHHEQAVSWLLRDPRGYLETLTNYTYEDDGAYLWIRVGDVRLAWLGKNGGAWDNSEVERYRNNHPMAWYIAKDMTIAPTGSWFVDLESFCGGYTRQKCSGLSDLNRKQELYALCVVRDFQRVTTQVRIAAELAAGNAVGWQQRKDIQEDTIDAMISAFNESRYLDAARDGDGMRITMSYAKLSDPLTIRLKGQELSRRY